MRFQKIRVVPFALLSLFILLVLILRADAFTGLRRNALSVRGYDALAGKSQRSAPDWSATAEIPDWERSLWYLALLADQSGDPVLAAEYIEQYLTNGGEEALRLVHAAFPDDMSYAHVAVRVQPDQAEAWSWLGDLYRVMGERERALRSYEFAVTVDAEYWPSLCWIGNLYREDDPEASFQAYRACCEHGENSANGCFHAGRMSEQLGDFETALKYYSLSDPGEAARLLLEYPEIGSGQP